MKHLEICHHPQLHHQNQSRERASEVCPCGKSLKTFDPDHTTPGETAMNEPIAL